MEGTQGASQSVGTTECAKVNGFIGSFAQNIEERVDNFNREINTQEVEELLLLYVEV